MSTKSCRECGLYEAVSHSALCRECRRIYSIEYYRKNREVLLAKQKQYSEENREEINQKRKQNRLDHSETHRIKQGVYRNANRERINFLKRLGIDPLKVTYSGMKRRCYNIDDSDYSNWGGKGVVICERWLGPNGFNHFCEDMGPSWERGKSIDRWPDRHGNYEPGNVRWATQKQQCNNLRKNSDYRDSISEDVVVFYNGSFMTLRQMSLETGIHLVAIKDRYALFAEVAKILKPPFVPYSYNYKHHFYSLVELGKISELGYGVLSKRILKYGWTIERAMETPLLRYRYHK